MPTAVGESLTYTELAHEAGSRPLEDNRSILVHDADTDDVHNVIRVEAGATGIVLTIDTDVSNNPAHDLLMRMFNLQPKERTKANLWKLIVEYGDEW
jgi:hypothetical protein